jgi:hypothetical protein
MVPGFRRNERTAASQGNGPQVIQAQLDIIALAAFQRISSAKTEIGPCNRHANPWKLSDIDLNAKV